MQPHLCHTTEARWFLPGSQNDTAWLTWFLADNTLPLVQEEEPPPASTVYAMAQSPRLDRYMIAPDSDRCSIKQRQGALDVKVQLSDPQPFSLGEISGRSDQWMKWSFSPRDEALKSAFVEDLQFSASWIDVEKRRYVVRTAWKDGVGAAPPLDDSAVRCQFELTQVNLPTAASGPNLWLTLGVELTVCSGQADIAINEACESFFGRREPPPMPLVAALSRNYPAWLAGVVNSAAASS